MSDYGLLIAQIKMMELDFSESQFMVKINDIYDQQNQKSPPWLCSPLSRMDWRGAPRHNRGWGVAGMI